MENPDKCPKCNSVNVYPDGNLWICPECFHEWSKFAAKAEGPPTDPAVENVIKDAFGNILKDGDSITVIKELKIKGSSSSVKVGTKVKNIRLTDGDNGHNIACKIDDFGAMNLKSEFVKKA